MLSDGPQTLLYIEKIKEAQWIYIAQNEPKIDRIYTYQTQEPKAVPLTCIRIEWNTENARAGVQCGGRDGPAVSFYSWPSSGFSSRFLVAPRETPRYTEIRTHQHTHPANTKRCWISKRFCIFRVNAKSSSIRCKGKRNAGLNERERLTHQVLSFGALSLWSWAEAKLLSLF